MKKLSLTFATAIIFALGTFTLRSMLTGSPASNPGVSSPAPRVSAATNVARSALPSQTPAAGKMGLIENYGRLPLSFEANQGQTDPQVKFLSRGHGYSLFLTGDEAVLALRSQKSEVRSQQGSADLLSKVRGFSRPDAQEPQRVATVGVLPTVGSSIVGGKPTVRRALTVATSFPPLIQNPKSKIENPPAPAVLRLKLVGANPAAKVSGADELPGKSNYFIGNDPKRWRTNVANYAKVKYQGVYPGVDLVYYGNQQQLEYDFVVAPGGDPRAVQFELVGEGSALPRAAAGRPYHIDPNGDLVIATDTGEVRFHKPVVYQPVAAMSSSPSAAANPKSKIENPKSVDGRYVLLADNRIGFAIGAYDPSQPLIIDPVLSYSTYLGGSNYDYAPGIAVDASGIAYLAGDTTSTDFPTMSPLQGSYRGGSSDAFVTKLNAAGNALVYSTYLGGSGGDLACAIAVDASGNAYVIGFTDSNNFPTTLGAFQPSYAGGYGDAYVTKLNADGSALVYSTYLGGNNYDYGFGIAVDAAGNAYVNGATYSSNFPTKGAFQTSLRGGYGADAFVTKLNAAGNALVYSTYLGGSGYDNGISIAVDSSGNAYLTGYTTSTNFPTMNPLQGSYGGGQYDVIVTKLNAAGNALVYSTYLGGSAYETWPRIAVDASGNAYISGVTDSSNFPTTPEAFQPIFGGGADAFVTKLNADGNALVYSTYLGGSDGDLGWDIAVDATGNAYLTGWSNSTNFPTMSPLQGSYGGQYDAFVTKLNAAGNALVYSSYLGGSGTEDFPGIAVDTSGNAYVTVRTTSWDLPTTEGAFQTGYGGGTYDAFVAKISFNRAPVANAGPDQTVECTSPAGEAVTLDGSASSDPDNNPLTYEWKDAGGSVVGNTPIVNLTRPLGTHIFTLTVNDGKGGTASDSVAVIVQDTTPPTLGVSLLPKLLWPPNHKLVPVVAVLEVSDLCDPSPTVVLVSIVSNEAVGQDIQGASFGTDDRSFLLRAERAGKGAGRVYTVTYRALDASGNMQFASADVIVPHDSR